MVNHGRSSACALCKQRRVRCDRVQPECTQCRKYGRPCPGVMDSKDRFFIINEGTSFGKPRAHKIASAVSSISPPLRATKPARVILTPPDSSDDSSRSESPLEDGIVSRHPHRKASSHGSVPDFNLISHLTQRIEDLAIAKEFTGSDTFGSAELGSKFFPRVYSKAKMDNPVRHAIEAHALIKFNQSYKDRIVNDTAASHYTRSLQLVQERLNNPALSGSNDTGIAIWMMAGYEYLAGGPTSLQRFATHITGLLTILTLRDPSELQTDPVFRQFLYTVTAQVIPSFLRQSRPFPRFRNGHSWLNYEREYQSGDDILDFFTRIGSGIVSLRAFCKEMFDTGEQPPTEKTCLRIIDEAIRIDHLLDGWYENLPTHWKSFETELREDNDLKGSPRAWERKSWPFYRHKYSLDATVKLLSHYFFLRLHVSVLVCRAANVVTPTISTALATHSMTSQLRLRDIADDFCASVCTFFTYPAFSVDDSLITLVHFRMAEVVPTWQRAWIDHCFDMARDKFGKSYAGALKSLRPCLITGRSEFGPEKFDK